MDSSARFVARLGPVFGPLLGPLVRLLLRFLPGFVVVAAMALAVDSAVITVLVALGVAVQVAVVAGYLVGNVVCYLLLCRFVYNVGWKSWKRYGRFFAGNMVGLLVRGGTATALVWAGLLESSALVAVAAVGASFTTNYLVTTLWAIRR